MFFECSSTFATTEGQGADLERIGVIETISPYDVRQQRVAVDRWTVEIDSFVSRRIQVANRSVGFRVGIARSGGHRIDKIERIGIVGEIPIDANAVIGWKAAARRRRWWSRHVSRKTRPFTMFWGPSNGDGRDSGSPALK